MVKQPRAHEHNRQRCGERQGLGHPDDQGYRPDEHGAGHIRIDGAWYHGVIP